jgi:hypothetical protein
MKRGMIIGIVVGFILISFVFIFLNYSSKKLTDNESLVNTTQINLTTEN